MNGPPRRVRALQWCFFAVWIPANTVLRYHYADARPRFPNPETGNIYLLNTHGSYAYLTFRDCVWLYGSTAVGFGGSVVIMAVHLWRRGWVW